MPKFIQIKLGEMIEWMGEEETKKILSRFSCPLNKDVENFLKEKAIEFSKQYLAKTTLVYWQSDDKKEKCLVGYYTLAYKYIRVVKKSLSNTMAKRMRRFSSMPPENGVYTIPAPLIAQLGKNYTDGGDCLIGGNELLHMAMDNVKQVQNEVGGRFVYLESENEEHLIRFYQDNGFTQFGIRPKDWDEEGVSGNCLLQWLMYL